MDWKGKLKVRTGSIRESRFPRTKRTLMSTTAMCNSVGTSPPPSVSGLVE